MLRTERDSQRALYTALLLSSVLSGREKNWEGKTALGAPFCVKLECVHLGVEDYVQKETAKRRLCLFSGRQIGKLNALPYSCDSHVAPLENFASPSRIETGSCSSQFCLLVCGGQECVALVTPCTKCTHSLDWALTAKQRGRESQFRLPVP
jgi:hypothetical protein